MTSCNISISDLVDHIHSGSKLAIPTDFSGFYSGVPMETTREIIRKRLENLHVVALPTSGLQIDMLVGAGCVSKLEASSLFMGEYGVPPKFSQGFHSKSFEMIESTCPAIHAGFQAGERGIPFIPIRGILGSDVVSLRQDWKVVQNPISAEEDPIILIPAINPDWSIFHAPMADIYGNIYYGRRRELAVMARASRGTLVTVEELYDGNLMENEALSCATLPDVYVTAFSVVSRGAWPYGFGGYYEEDREEIRRYIKQAATTHGFDEYLQDRVYGHGKIDTQ